MLNQVLLLISPTTVLGVLLYWVPMSFCVFAYTVRTFRNFEKDRLQRETPGVHHYFPTDTVGTLIGRAVVSLLPVANLWAALFDLAPEVFEKLFKWIGEVFDMPLVPDTERAKVKRKSEG